MTPQTKHGPNRFSSYQQIHTTVMQQLVREGFVLSDELQFRDMGYGAIVLEGETTRSVLGYRAPQQYSKIMLAAGPMSYCGWIAVRLLSGGREARGRDRDVDANR